MYMYVLKIALYSRGVGKLLEVGVLKKSAREVCAMHKIIFIFMSCVVF